MMEARVREAWTKNSHKTRRRWTAGQDAQWLHVFVGWTRLAPTQVQCAVRLGRAEGGRGPPDLSPSCRAAFDRVAWASSLDWLIRENTRDERDEGRRRIQGHSPCAAAALSPSGGRRRRFGVVRARRQATRRGQRTERGHEQGNPKQMQMGWWSRGGCSRRCQDEVVEDEFNGKGEGDCGSTFLSGVASGGSAIAMGVVNRCCHVPEARTWSALAGCAIAPRALTPNGSAADYFSPRPKMFHHCF